MTRFRRWLAARDVIASFWAAAVLDWIAIRLAARAECLHDRAVRAAGRLKRFAKSVSEAAE